MKIHFVDQQWLGPETKKIEQEAFEKAGMEIEFHDWGTEDEIIAGAQDADAVMVVAVPMSRRVIEALPKLKFIGRCGIGYDSVDLDAATERGIPVCNVPDYCAYEVASQSFLLALTLKKHLLDFVARGRAGAYGQGEGHIVHRLSDQVFGQIGFGRIAREQAKMVRGMGMEILVYDPFLKEIQMDGIRLCSTLEEVLRNSDIVSINTVLNPGTYHMIGMKELKQMKKDSVIVNLSRGAIINTDDLLTALREGTPDSEPNLYAACGNVFGRGDDRSAPQADAAGAGRSVRQVDGEYCEPKGQRREGVSDLSFLTELLVSVTKREDKYEKENETGHFACTCHDDEHTPFDCLR